MLKKSKLKLLFKSLFVSLGQVKTDDGVILLYEEDTELMVGYKVYVEKENEDGEIEYVAPENGDYVSGDTTFTIEDGVCTKIENKEVAKEVDEDNEPEQVQEEMAEETVEETVIEEPVVEEPAAPEFNAEQAIADLRSEFNSRIADLEQKVADMKVQLDELLALPVEESAFEKETKEESKNKPIFKSKK